MNLLKETQTALNENGKTLQDVVWIGTKEVEIPVEEFVRLADKEYSSGFGSQKVATDLLVCGEDWFMERHEYDGSEWWEFKLMPPRPNKKVVPKTVVGDEFMWATLKAMNHPNGQYGDYGSPFDWEGMILEDA